MTSHEIQNAINAAEAVASPLKKDDQPVTVSNKTLMALIEAAKANSICLFED